MLHRMALVRTDVYEGRIASIIKVTGIGGLGTTLVVTSNNSIPSQRASVDRNVGSYNSHAV
jgi:hypothetical protein